jgi:solute:Na+ symporter, SSS family
MSFHITDLFFFIGFFVLVIGLSVWKSRRGRGHEDDSSDFFLAGRGLTWPLIGISIVAANISTEQMVGMAGQAAGDVGLAVAGWQLMGALGIVVISMTLMPRFLRAGIYTMPEFLEYRYNTAARVLMAVLTVIIYSLVMLPGVLYSGGVTLRTLAGMDLTSAVWTIGFIGAVYATFGGLKAIVWADLVQGLALLAGGMLVFFLGLQAVGGWGSFVEQNGHKLHMILPANNAALPWTGVLGGMWIVLIYYCGLNQFIVQRNLAAKTLKDGQLGMIFAGALWLIVPFSIVMPGLMANQLYADDLSATPDAAFPTMIKNLVQPGLRGLICAAIAGAVTSTLASLLNSASTIATMDIYHRLGNRKANEATLVWLGRGLTVLFLLVGCSLAPVLDDPKFGGVFQFIQQFQGYIWPGVVAAFMHAFLLPRAPASSGAVALVLGPVCYGVLQYTSKSDSRPWGHGIHYLLQVLLAFLVVSAVMWLMSVIRPLKVPRVLPVREDMVVIKTEPVVKVAAAAVILAIVAFYVLFW